MWGGFKQPPRLNPMGKSPAWIDRDKVMQKLHYRLCFRMTVFLVAQRSLNAGSVRLRRLL